MKNSGVHNVGWLVSVAVWVGSGALVPGASGQESKAFFDAPVVVLDDSSRFNALADFNGDGRMDGVGFVFPTTQEYRVTAWTQGSAGNFSQVWSQLYVGEIELLGERDVLPLAAGDLGGVPGFVMATRNDGVQFRRFPFSSGVWASFPNPGITDLLIADLNGDGLGDVAALAGSTLLLYLSPSSGVGIPTVQQFPVSERRRLFTAEVNGDASVDLVLYDDSGIELCPLVGGVPVVQSSWTTGASHRVATGDVDGDGDEDLVVFENDEANPTVQVYERVGAGEFSPGPVVPGGPAEMLFDVDGDGDPDGLCCGSGAPDPINKRKSIFFVSLNDGNGNFASSFPIQGLAANFLAGAADIDLDGDVDLVAGRVVYYGHDESYRPRSVPTSGTLHPTVVVDLEDDGDLDVLGEVSSGSYGRNDGGAGFEGTPLALPTAPSGTEFRGTGRPADWDGDGDVDLVLEQWQGNSFLGMRLLRNTGGGVLIDGGMAGGAGVAFALIRRDEAGMHFRALDVDDDGDLDFCGRHVNISGQDGGRISLNDGTGFFQIGQAFDEGHVVDVADFDGDLIPDLILRHVNFSGSFGELYLSRGLGAGSFAAPETLAFIGGSGLPTVEDIDHDGDPDLALIDTQGNRNLEFLINDGTGVFTSMLPFPSVLFEGRLNFSSGRLFFVDVDQDGQKDLVTNVANADEEASWILLRTGPGAGDFELSAEQTFRPAVVGDFDGDGDPDAVDHEGRLLPNRRYEGAFQGRGTQFGQPHPGTGGIVPILGAVGPFRSGFEGQLRFRAGLGGAQAFLVAGTREGQWARKGGFLYVLPGELREFTLSGTGTVPGEGEFELDLPDRAHFAGRTFVLQVGVVDPGASHGVALSNGLRLAFGAVED